MKTHRFVPLLFLVACADGGTDDRPRGDVTLNAQHHQFGFRSLRGFGAFPVTPSATFAEQRVLNLFDDSSYSVTSGSSTSTRDTYALDNDGTLSMFVSGFGNEPSVVFRGAYDRVGTSGTFFFTDRVSTPNGPSIGIYLGTQKLVGQVELEGGWHLVSLHTIFNQTILAPENVGRAAHGGVSIGAGTPGSQRTVSGTGFQGTGALTFGGTIQNVLDGAGNGDGTCSLTVNYQLAGQAADSRVMLSAANNNVIFGLDRDETDGEAGLLLMVRKFDAPAAPVNSASALGTFLVGGHTLFVNPSNSGSDTFIGVVTLGTSNAFRLDGISANGEDFAYAGTYTLAQDGGMSIAIAGTNETWFAAISKDYNTLVVVDDFQEIRANNTPELNLAFGVRRKVN